VSISALAREPSCPAGMLHGKNAPWSAAFAASALGLGDASSAAARLVQSAITSATLPRRITPFG
jgi:hypothetical protein